MFFPFGAPGICPLCFTTYRCSAAHSCTSSEHVHAVAFFFALLPPPPAAAAAAALELDAVRLPARSCCSSSSLCSSSAPESAWSCSSLVAAAAALLPCLSAMRLAILRGAGMLGMREARPGAEGEGVE